MFSIGLCFENVGGVAFFKEGENIKPKQFKQKGKPI